MIVVIERAASQLSVGMRMIDSQINAPRAMYQFARHLWSGKTSRGKMNSEIAPRRMNSAAAQVRCTSASRSWLSVAFFGAAWKNATPRAEMRRVSLRCCLSPTM